jgi:peptidoglycan/xylan/chitin deacetylase (PgdA/CDA1 family)
VHTALLLVLLAPAPADSQFLRGRTVVLSVDDGHHSVYENVFPLLRRYGMTMTLALIVGNVGTGRPSYDPSGRFLNALEVREMLDSCDIEIASHTLSHRYLSQLDSSAAWREIRQSKLALESLFGVPVVTFVYPYGDADARARRLTRRAGYRLARAVRWGDVDFWNDPYRLPEFDLRAGTSLADAKAHVRRRKTSILLLHRIVPHPTKSTEWPVSDFSELLAWLHRRGARTVTLADLYYEWWRERVESLLAEGRPSPAGDSLFEQVDVDAAGTAHTRRAERLHVLSRP